jgi:hypothetical protein
MSSSADFRMKLPPVGVVLVGTDTMADRGYSGWMVSGRWGLLHGHQWGVPNGHQWGLSHGHGHPSAIDFDENVILNFCSYVHFFTSPTSGSQWIAEHPATFLLSLEEAFDLGRRTNEARYGTAL